MEADKLKQPRVPPLIFFCLGLVSLLPLLVAELLSLVAQGTSRGSDEEGDGGW